MIKKFNPKHFSNARLITIACFILVLALIGAHYIFNAKAASPYVAIEAESGKLTSPATTVTNSAASGGSYVQFGTASTPPPPNGAPLLGLWINGAGSASQFGVTQQVLEDFASPGGGTGTFTSYSVPSTSLRIMLAVGDLNSSEASSIGGALVSSGHANTIFRVMVEQNQCEWNTSWNESKFSASQYVSAFQSVVTELRAVPNNQFTFIWNPNAGEGNNCNGETTAQTWPGAAYVNAIGVDVYDYGGYETNAQEIIDFATGHPESGWPQLSTPIPFAVPEWGLNGSDDTTFMNYMIGIIKAPANDTYVQSYFSCGPSQGCSSPNSDLTEFSNSEAAYKAGFAGE